MLYEKYSDIREAQEKRRIIKMIFSDIFKMAFKGHSTQVTSMENISPLKDVKTAIR